MLCSRSNFEQMNALRKRGSRHETTLVKEDTSSLLVIGDADFNYTDWTVSTGNSNFIDSRFDFDGEIFKSRVYQGALRSNMMHNLSRQHRNMDFLCPKSIRSPKGAIHDLRLKDSGDHDEPVGPIFPIASIPHKHLDIVQTKQILEHDSATSDGPEVNVQKLHTQHAFWSYFPAFLEHRKIWMYITPSNTNFWDDQKDEILALYEEGLSIPVIHKRIQNDVFRIRSVLHKQTLGDSIKF